MATYRPFTSSLPCREDRKRGVYVDKLSEWVVRNEAEILELMARGAQARTTGATKLNDMSSRSHAVFIIIVEQSQGCQQAAAGQDLNQTMSESRQLGMAAAMPDMPVSIKVRRSLVRW
jgi:kinesin family protein 3/17